jgi:hypothetical protein
MNIKKMRTGIDAIKNMDPENMLDWLKNWEQDTYQQIVKEHCEHDPKYLSIEGKLCVEDYLNNSMVYPFREKLIVKIAESLSRQSPKPKK